MVEAGVRWAGLALVRMLTLWREERWQPVSCRKPFEEILFIERLIGAWARVLPGRHKPHIPRGRRTQTGMVPA